MNATYPRWLPGLRTVKTGLAVLLCLVFYFRIRPELNYELELSFYAVIAAVISMDKTIPHSFRAGRTRMIGTFWGALLGSTGAWLVIQCGHDPRLIPPACGVGIILLIWSLERFRLNDAITIASIVFLAIMVGFGNADPTLYSGRRLLITMIGILAAWLVNIGIFPYDNLNKVKQQLREVHRLCETALQHLVGQRRKASLRQLDTAIAAYKTESDLYNVQFSWKPKLPARRLLRNQLLLNNLFAELTTFSRLDPEKISLDPDNCARLRQRGINAAGGCQATDADPTLSTLGNHHLRAVLDILDQLEPAL